MLSASDHENPISFDKTVEITSHICFQFMCKYTADSNSMSYISPAMGVINVTGIGAIRQATYDFLLVFNCNYASIL